MFQTKEQQSKKKLCTSLIVCFRLNKKDAKYDVQNGPKNMALYFCPYL